LSEQQQKPAKKWYKKWTNILVLLVLSFVIIYVIINVLTMEIHYSGGHYYNIFKDNIQNAVQYYQDKNEGGLPTVNGTVTVNGSLCHIIDICALLVSEGGKLSQIPDSCVSINGSDNDNCDAGCGENSQPWNSCTEYSHYIWVVDESGNVHSTCVGSDCNAYNTDGYQGVWP
jgi:hypothetical protein